MDNSLFASIRYSFNDY